MCWIIEKAREFLKNVYLCSIYYTKAFDSVDRNKLWKTLKDMGIPEYLTCLLRNLHLGQEAKVRILYGTTNWFKIEREVWQDCLLSPGLFDLNAEHVMRNARLDELQAGIKISRRNINNLRYADDTTLMAEGKEELKSLLIEGERGEWKSWLKSTFKKLRSWHVLPSLHSK